MASAIAMNAKNGLLYMDLGMGPGLGKAVAETGVEFVAGGLIGEIYHRHQDKFVGRHIGPIAGAVGKLGSVLAQIVTGGEPSIVGGIFNSIGCAGVAMAGCELGLRHARSATGKRAVLVDKSAALPAGAREVTTIGELPPAQPGGKSLTWDQIEELANMH